MSTTAASDPTWLKVLRAAHSLESGDGRPFTANALVVAAWERNPETFGLEGYEHPDSNRVLWNVMGSRGLVSRGYLERVEQKLYRLTPDGRRAARITQESRTSPPVTSEPASRVALPRTQEPALLRMLDSTALAKHVDGRKSELTFTDAVMFWGMGVEITGPQLDARLEAVETTLRLAERATTVGELVLSTGRVVTAEDVERLLLVDSYLRARFAGHCALLRNRKAGT